MSKIDEMLSQVKLVDDAEAETCDYVVCMRKDDAAFIPQQALFGTCKDCGAAVFFSPVAPKTPPRVCNVCMEGRDVSDAITVTKDKALAEISQMLSALMAGGRAN